jgi:hypothetical protein
VLTELLLPHPGIGEIRLLGPSLVATQKGGRLVMLFDRPAQLSAPNPTTSSGARRPTASCSRPRPPSRKA